MTDGINYKDQLYLSHGLETALKKEWEKFRTCPVLPDMAPEHEMAEAWGYVIAGYFLIEQGLKAVRNMRGHKPPKTHALSVLFAEMPEEDKEVLDAYYDDFLKVFEGTKAFPISTLDKFLVNLDGARNSRGQHMGSFDWRYFLTEEGSGGPMPLVSINIMHEIAYGCVRLVASVGKQNRSAVLETYSWRLRLIRSEKYQDWLMVRMNSQGWNKEGARIEKLWGPDYRDRYDYLVFKDGETKSYFASLPDPKIISLPLVDKRAEVAAFNVEEGFRSIGIMVDRPAKRGVPKRDHVMF